jgi:hypothetical protein
MGTNASHLRLHARRSRWSRRRKTIPIMIGCLLAGSGAYAATDWTVGLNDGSSGEGQSGAVSNLTISAVSAPSASDLLYPGGDGDVVITVTNPNPFPVTITAVDLPSDTTYADGYTTSALTALQAGCTAATPSGVIWSFSSATSGTSHALSTPLTVGGGGQANNPLVVTLTNDATMTTGSPAACESTFFSMPSLAGLTATASGSSSTSSPATDAWTS